MNAQLFVMTTILRYFNLLQVLHINIVLKGSIFANAERCRCKETWSNDWCQNQKGCPHPPECNDWGYRWCEVENQDVECDDSEVDNGIRWAKCDDTISTWKHCADEGNECSCEGTVRYGADTKFHYKAVVGKITCAKNNFDGDPIKQTSKT